MEHQIQVLPLEQGMAEKFLRTLFLRGHILRELVFGRMPKAHRQCLSTCFLMTIPLMRVPKNLFSIPNGQWTQYTIPWSDLGNPSKVRDLVFQEGVGLSGKVVSYDDIRFIDKPYTLTSTEVIYDDAMNTNWASYSSSGFDLNNTALNTVKVGTKSIKAMPMSAWEYFLANSSTTLNPANFPGGIGFWALGTTTNGTNTKVRIAVQTKNSTGASTQEKQIELTKDAWTYINVSWTDLANPTDVKEVVIKDISRGRGTSFLFG